MGALSTSLVAVFILLFGLKVATFVWLRAKFGQMDRERERAVVQLQSMLSKAMDSQERIEKRFRVAEHRERVEKAGGIQAYGRTKTGER